jgi:O-antigen/teichoic acid export membrane protein
MKTYLRRNSLILFFSEGLSCFLSAATVIVIARTLSVSDFGSFAAGLSYAQIMVIFIDSGMGQFVARNIARGTSQGLLDLNQLFTWRMGSMAVICLLNPLIARICLPSAATWRLAIILTPAMMLLAMTDFFCWTFKGAQRVGWVAVLQIGGKALLFLLCAAAARLSMPMRSFIVVHGIAGVFVSVFGSWIVSRFLFKIRFTPLPELFFRQTLPNVYKLGGIIIMGVMLSRVDVMLVSRFCGNLEAGLFGSAARLIDALRVIPMVAYGVCLPAFSNAHDDPQTLKRLFKTAYAVLLLVSWFLAMVATLFASTLFSRVLGIAYVASVPYFKTLTWSCVFNFPNVLMLAILYSKNDHKTPALAVGAALIMDIVLNCLFLPHSGPLAASWVRFSVEGLAFIIQGTGILRARLLSAQELFILPALAVGMCLAISFIGLPQ